MFLGHPGLPSEVGGLVLCAKRETLRVDTTPAPIMIAARDATGIVPACSSSRTAASSRQAGSPRANHGRRVLGVALK